MNHRVSIIGPILFSVLFWGGLLGLVLFSGVNLWKVSECERKWDWKNPDLKRREAYLRVHYGSQYTTKDAWALSEYQRIQDIESERARAYLMCDAKRELAKYE